MTSFNSSTGARPYGPVRPFHEQQCPFCRKGDCDGTVTLQVDDPARHGLPAAGGALLTTPVHGKCYEAATPEDFDVALERLVELIKGQA